MCGLAADQAQFEQFAQYKLSLDVQVQDPRLLTLAFRFYNLLCAYCLRVARGNTGLGAEYVMNERQGAGWEWETGGWEQAMG